MQSPTPSDRADAAHKICRRISGPTAGISAALLLIGAPASAHASKQAWFTQSQASQGQKVYSTSCSACHGANMQGVGGPALKGATFASNMGYAKISAAKLYHFISTHMPKKDPGSLNQNQYLDVFSYLLSQNGFPAGQSKLTEGDLQKIALLPLPKGNGAPNTSNGSQHSNEIVRTENNSTTSGAQISSGSEIAVDNSMMRGAAHDAQDWLLHGRTYSNQRYSPLDQITPDNISRLSPVALVQTGMTASFEATPVVVHGVMYISTPVVGSKMKILAVDAATGQRYWTTTYNLGSNKTCCGPVNRGVAVGYGRVYVVTLDDSLLALNAQTGKKEWKTKLADPRAGYSETMAPQIYDNMVIVGSAGGEWPLRGFVAAYNAKSGKQLWRFHTTDPNSFEGDSWKTGGGTVWTTPAIDPKRGLVIFSTGNPNPDLNGTHRKGDNLYTDSIVALDARTGKLKWHYQEVKHDVWDYDAVSNVVLFNVRDQGRTVPAAGEAGKVGWLFIVNRDTGKLIRKSQPLVRMSANMFKKPTKNGVDILPGANGGEEWSPPAYSPKTHMLYAMEMNQLMRFTTQEPSNIRGLIRLGSTFKNVKGDKAVQNGVIDAVDVDTGKIAWKYHAPQPLIGGVLATGGNLVFIGEGNGWFDALNAKTGKRLWHYNLGAGVNAPPITYEVDGHQYIAVAAGGNFQLDYPRGDVVAIFRLR